MAGRDSETAFPDRDGTSQQARELAALDPEHVLVDERSMQDLLQFARRYGAQLKYFDGDNVESGDWSSFVDPRLNLDEVAAFMDHPERFSPDTSPLLFRPHFVLFLAFLRLIRRAQGALNSFGRRHLDFYFREFLRLAGKPARPDRVNLLLDLAPGATHARLATGTLVTAGPDSLNRERLYATDRETVINRSQVERLSSVHVARRITGLGEARVRHNNDHQAAALTMLEIAIGHPEPGDPVPAYPGRGELDFELLVDQANLIGFAGTELHLRFFELRELMVLLGQRRAQADKEWARINLLLHEAGRSRDPAFMLDGASRDFDRNLIAVAGGKPPFNRLSEVDDVYDLYDQRTTLDAREFIGEQLFFKYDAFVEMMQIKVKADNQWSGINRLLETAGRRRRDEPGYQLAVRDPSDFDANLGSALEGLDFSTLGRVDSLDAYHAAVVQAERYFFVSAEGLAYLLPALIDPQLAVAEWRKVDSILVGAHRDKRRADRRKRLEEIHGQRGFAPMIRFALGEDPATSGNAAALEQLEPFLSGATDLALLERLQRDPGSATAEHWRTAYGVIENAQWNREGRGEPVPSKEEWLNIYPASDATTRTANAPEESGESPQWHTFGRPDMRAEGERPDSVLGWALTSPLLALSEGARKVQLTLGFDPGSFHGDRLEALLAGDPLRDGSPLRFAITTEKGWIEPDSVAVAIGAYAQLKGGGPAGAGGEADALRFELTFPEDADALAAAPPEVAGLDSRWPVLRLMLGQVWEPKLKSHIILYPLFRTLNLSAVHTRVSVTGLHPTHLQNDESILDPKKPFEPFGSSPAAGSRLQLGHRELAAKRLQSLACRVEWMGLPADLDDHYRAYGVKSSQFTVALSLVDRRVERTLKASAPLFNADGLSVGDVPSAVAPLDYTTLETASTSDDGNEWRRHLQWELDPPGFQHQAYPAVASAKAIKMAAAIANRKGGETIKPDDYQVNPPYTPKIKSLLIDYVSELEIDVEAKPLRTDLGEPSDRILHVHPFGTCDAEAERTREGLPFVPRYENEGELYVGVREVSPPQTLSLLFQMAEGSADPDLKPQTLVWSFLSGDRWLPLDERMVLLDTTRGFRNSGIVELALEPAQPSRRLRSDLYWVRASVARNSASLCDAMAIHAQAVAATFVDADNAPDHFAQPLPPESIYKLVEPNPQIAAVRQPYTSAGGRKAEQESAFNTRVSERLRHKQRAVTTWDYERLVLERFPAIYKVKCIPARLAPTGGRPGVVRVVVVPDVRNKLPFNPFGPRAPADLLADIQEYLDARAPPSAAVEVMNPHYVAVKVRLGVRFRAGGNEGYFKELLVNELNRFLSPWAYDEGAEIVIAGKIYANSIVNFLDRRPYVDYLADIRLFASDDGENFRPISQRGGGSYFVSAGRPDGVLVAARQHEIDLIPETGYEHDLLTGINFMKVELDLEVAEDPSPS